MKLVTRSPDLSYLEDLKRLLEANGIPAFIKGESTARTMPPLAVMEPSLWVFLDAQQLEADKLILDPKYKVENKVNVAEFYAATKEITENPRRLNDVLLNYGVGIGAILFLIFLLLKWLGA